MDLTYTLSLMLNHVSDYLRTYDERERIGLESIKSDFIQYIDMYSGHLIQAIETLEHHRDNPLDIEEKTPALNKDSIKRKGAFAMLDELDSFLAESNNERSLKPKERHSSVTSLKTSKMDDDIDTLNTVENELKTISTS
mmetsp:Transcript_29039/g.53370  ORF Transcript_29039/g.53370 Transcript_29039/m.53370 type:complete len:139 (-) Transcript_29039:119-535(-)